MTVALIHSMCGCTDLADFDFHHHTHSDLLTRAWALRENVTAYDAMYAALAEALDATVVTCDARLGEGAGTPSANRAGRLRITSVQAGRRWRPGATQSRRES